MFLLADDRYQIARLFAFLLQGEQLARDCSRQQARLFEDSVAKKFLINQSRQEKFHCSVFKAGVGILAPRGVSEIPGKKQMNDYRRLVEESLKRGDANESLLAMQIILEGLGDVLVKRIDAGFERRGIGGLCRRVRHLIVGQEDAHHAFGVNRFEQQFEHREIPIYLLRRSQDYLGLLNELVVSVSPMFACFDEDVDDYMCEFYAELPDVISEQRS
jgi:hypothetical protein